MNFNLYVDDTTARKLDALARATKTPRNALVRRAIAAWLERGAGEWPTVVTEFEGDPSVAPFESSRVELGSPVDDPFGFPRRARTKRRRPEP